MDFPFTFENMNFYKNTDFPNSNEVQVGDGTNHGSGLANSVESITIPSYINNENINYKVTSLAKYCFRSKTELKNVILPSTIKIIHLDTFWNTSITTLILPKSIEILESHCFSTMKSLTTVIFEKGFKAKFNGIIFKDMNVLKSFYYCENKQIENSDGPADAFYNTSIPTIFVPPSYESETFLGHTVSKMNTKMCDLLKDHNTCNVNNHKYPLSCYTIFIMYQCQ